MWQDDYKIFQTSLFVCLSTGLKAPTGKGSCMITTHTGSEEVFVNKACEILRAKKNAVDYHSEMNTARF